MSYIIGIDTGGTFTDGVVISRSTSEVIKRLKTPTTHWDYSLSIMDILRNLCLGVEEQVDYIALSTTLATNAIVENKGGRVGAVFIGIDPFDTLPECISEYVAGKYDIEGNEVEPLDISRVREILISWKGRIDAVVVSGYLSVRNQRHENMVCELANEILNVPVVCAHELCDELGVYERSVTAVLNGKLVPVIRKLLDSLRDCLDQMDLDIPIMVVRGNGSLMGENVARIHPIETILSGPAASVMGAGFLLKNKDGIVFDMGGTTSDVCILKDSAPLLGMGGARVGGWDTKVRAAQISTHALGGDSYVCCDHTGQITVGPNRVIPISYAAYRWENLRGEYSRIITDNIRLLIDIQITDAYLLMMPSEQYLRYDLKEFELQILEQLQEIPHTAHEIASKLGVQMGSLTVQRLLECGIISRIGMTPTDILHDMGDVILWDNKTVKTALNIFCNYYKVDRNSIDVQVCNIIYRKIAKIVYSSLAWGSGCSEDVTENALFELIVNEITSGETGQIRKETGSKRFGKTPGNSKLPLLFSIKWKSELPIIGIGAPVRAWLPQAASRMELPIIIPPDQDVANAIGAAVAKVFEVLNVIIQPGDGMCYNLFSGGYHETFYDVEEAIRFGEEYASVQLKQMIARQKENCEYSITIDKKMIKVQDGFVECKIHAIASEINRWE